MPKETLRALGTVCTERGVAAPAVLLGAVHVLMSRHTGLEESLVFVSREDDGAVPGAQSPNSRNFVPTHVSFTSELTAGALIDSTSGALAWTPGWEPPSLEELLSDVFQVEPHRLHTISPVAVVFEGFHVVADKRADRAPAADFDLVVLFSRVDTALEISIEYDGELFEQSSLQSLLDQLMVVLHQIVADPERSVSKMTLMREEQCEAALRTQLGNPIPFEPSKPLHERFKEIADECPEAVALVQSGTRLTYGALDRRANQIAVVLRRAGVGPNRIVGLYLDQSIDAVVGMLAILKAGGAYLPMNASQPDARVRFQLEDSDATVVLTRRDFHQRLPHSHLTVICIDDPAIERESVEDLGVTSAHDDLAYLLYTSGSTGQPKGALIEHRNVTRLFDATDAWFRFSSNDVWTLFHSITFDFSVWEIWGALLYGGRVIIVDPMVARSPDLFLNLLRMERVTVLNQTPSAFRLLDQADESEPGQNLSLRTIIFGGEALDLPSLRSWVRRHGDDRPELVNMYGITETTVHVTHRRVRKADIASGPRSPIGRPIPDLQLTLLDRNGKPVPQGARGEIYVGGAGVARGYWRRDDLTGERFLPHPFPTEGNTRIYRTGDEGRWLPNGELEYLGRLDRQVKIRGFRIELGEIEAAIRDHAAVRECVVVSRKDLRQNHRLAAYLVPSTPGNDLGSALKQFLDTRLPDYMVPTSFTMVDRIPLTASGKVDRERLPEPADDQVKSESLHKTLTPVEAAIAATWRELLSITQLSRDDHFFEIGGDSIMAVDLVHRLRDRLGADLSVVDVFQYPTIKALAERVHGGTEPHDAGVVDARANRQRQARARQRRRHGG